MGIFSFLRFNRGKKSGTPTPGQKNTRRLLLEALEDRFLPSCNVISGFVYHDLNNNGIFDANESPIAGSTVKLLDADNVEVATAVSGANGFYEFAYDQTVATAQTTITQFADFSSADDPSDTNFTLTDVINKFDPSQGQLLSVTITHEGAVNTLIQVENTSTTSDSEIHAQVGGKLTLKIVGADFTHQITLSEVAGDFIATTYDGVTDYAGSSGHTFTPAVSAYDSDTVLLTGAAMDEFIGTGTITLQEKAVASSFASGGGNLDVQLNSTGWGKATITYTYLPNNCLDAGNYTIVQTATPPEFPLDGKETRNGVPVNNPLDVSVIPVTLVDGVDLINNNFGELKTASISGHVYQDNQNDGSITGDPRLSGQTVTLTGANDIGPITPIVAITDSNGFYQFNNLRPGVYTVTETQDPNYLDGKDSVGSIAPQTTDNDTFINIQLQSGDASINNNFGELLPASLSGFVYVDLDNDGIKDGNEAGIAGVAVTLSGTNDMGSIGTIVATTDGNGFYKFDRLRPGTYTITEQDGPALTPYVDGKDTAGTPVASTAGNDVISSVVLAAGVNGQNNNFGEREQADLKIEKSADKDEVFTGGQLTYTLTITNLGVHTAKNVAVTDLLPPGATFVSASADASWTAGISNGNRIWTTAELAAGVTKIITITINAPSVEGTIINTGRVTSETPDKDPSNNEDSVPTNVIREKADLAIDKIADRDQIVANEELTYTLVISNLGTHTAANVVVTDTLPPGVEVLNITAGPEWTIATIAGGRTFSTGAMAVGAIKFITITIKSPATTGTILNSAIVSSTTFDPNLLNNSDSVTTPVTPPQADLAIDKLADQDEVRTNEQLTYTLIVSNLGTHTAENVVVTDTLPPGVEVLSVVAGPEWTVGTVAGGRTFSTGAMAVGAVKFITITIKAPAVAGNILNSAVVNSTTLDPNPSNNSDSVTTPVKADQADLAVEKIADRDQVVSGESLTYTLVITNLGTHTAKNVVVTDTLPPGAVVQSISAGPEWTIGGTGVIRTFSTGEMAVGEVKFITITVQAPSFSGSMLNSVVVASTTYDPNLSNNNDSVITLVSPERADLAITKTASKDEVKINERFTYTLTISNLGTHTAQSVLVTDALPEGVVYRSATGTGWTITYSGGIISATRSELAPNAAGVIVITVDAPAFEGVIVNPASVTSLTPDPNQSNNHDNAIVTVENDGPDLPKTLTPFETTVTTVRVISKLNINDANAHLYISTATRSAHAFVDGVFRALLGRPATASEQLFYVKQLKAGVTRAQIVETLWFSDAHLGLQAENYYQTFYHRSPTAAEQAALISQLKTQVNEMDIAYQFLTSSEYLTAHPGAQSFIAGFYQDVIGNPASNASEQIWLNAMGVNTVQMVAANMLYSTDALHAIIELGYANTLHRFPTDAELQLLTSKLQTNQLTPGDLMQQLLASDEFYNLALSVSKVA